MIWQMSDTLPAELLSSSHSPSALCVLSQVMDAATAARCLELLSASPDVTTLDLTGGAPELCPQFR